MGPKAFVPSIYCPWPLFTLQDLAEKSPTRLYRNAEGISKGLSQKREDDQIKTAFELMGDAGVCLKLHHAMPTAIVFARRYYSVKSLQQNDRFIVACACLFLAAKCEEEMRALNDVCYQTYKSRYKDNPEALKNMQDVQFFNSFKEIVLTAERSLLYALGFQLDIRHPYYWSTTILKRLGNLPGTGQPWDGPWWQEYSQKTRASRTNFINDLYRRTTLVLRYDLRIISFAVIHVTIPIMYPDIGRPTANHDKVPLIDLEPWYSYVLKTERPEVVESAASNTPSRASTTYEPEQKVTVSLLIEISKEIMSLYGKAKKAGPPQAPGAAVKPKAPEMGPDGPITPLVEEFGTPRSDGSPSQVDATGKPTADGPEPGSEALAPAPAAKTVLNPAAPDFVPGAGQPPADSSAALASASAIADGELPGQQAGEQTNVQRVSRKRSLDEASLQEQASPSKRAASTQDREFTAGRPDDVKMGPAESAGNAQPSADKHSLEGASTPATDMEVDPSAAIPGTEPQRNGTTLQEEPMDTLPSGVGMQAAQSHTVLPAGATALTNHVQPAGASDLANGLQPPVGVKTAPAMPDALQQAPHTSSGALPAGCAAPPNGVQPAGASALRGQPSVASEEGELLAEMQALEDSYQPQAAADPAAASERLKKWQAGQVKQKAEVEGSCNPARPDQEAGADELEAELEDLGGPAQPKQAHTDPAVATERRKKLQQQLQALNGQKAA